MKHNNSRFGIMIGAILISWLDYFTGPLELVGLIFFTGMLVILYIIYDYVISKQSSESKESGE